MKASTFLTDSPNKRSLVLAKHAVKPRVIAVSMAIGALVFWVLVGALLVAFGGMDEHVADAWWRRLSAVTLLAMYPFIHRRLGTQAPRFQLLPRDLTMILLGTAVASSAYMVLALTQIYSSFAVAPVPGKLTSPTEALRFMLLGGGLATKATVLASMTLAALLEETLFRGVLLGALLTVLRPGPAVLVSIMLFVVFHLSTNPWYIASLSLMGLAFTWTAIRFGLTGATLLHMAYNLPAFLLFNIDGSESSFGLLPTRALSDTGHMLLRLNLPVSVLVAFLPVWWMSRMLRHAPARAIGPRDVESGCK